MNSKLKQVREQVKKGIGAYSARFIQMTGGNGTPQSDMDREQGIRMLVNRAGSTLSLTGICGV